MKKKSFSSQQVIVSGATGFVGQHLIPLLLKQGYEVVAIARNKKKAESFDWYSSVNFICADIYDKEINILPKKNSSLIHLVWQDLSSYNSLTHLEENFPRSSYFIKSLVDTGVSNVLVTGTCFEYGFQSGPLDTAKPARPSNPYALAKDALHKYLIILKKNRPFALKWARLFYLYGEGQKANSIMSQLDTAIDKGEKIFNMSGGEQLRDFLSIEHAVEKIMGIFQNDKEGVFNVCSGKPISIRRLVEERIIERGASIKLNLNHYPYPDYEPMAFWGDSS